MKRAPTSPTRHAEGRPDVSAGTEDLERVLTTILFTDVVDSTAHVAALGDRRWLELLEQYYARAEREVRAHLGREIDRAGDGLFAAFDGPARAVRCAQSIHRAVADLGLTLRSGVHTGECELLGSRIAGIAVHLGARVASAAAPGEVLVSSTVRDLVCGSTLSFVDRGTHTLKGMPRAWQLFAAVA